MVVAVSLLVGGACLACGGSKSDALEPIAECKAYEALVARCTGRPAHIAEQPAALPSAAAEREHVRQVCAFNLKRLTDDCR
jgi:hypothetical protein